MKSNLKLSAIEQKLAYLQAYLLDQGKFLSKHGMKIINVQLSEVKAQLAEARARVSVGTTEGGNVAYVSDSVIKGFEGGVLYIEGLPSGWDATSFDMTPGNTVDVVVDGGQEWSETITFI